MDNFLKIVLGDQTLDNFAGYMAIAAIGIFITLLYHAVQRNQASPRTPVEFNFLFLLKDNALRLMASLCLSLFTVFVCIRFTNDILHVNLSPFIALLIGLGSDKLAELLKGLASNVPDFKPVKTELENENARTDPEQQKPGEAEAKAVEIDPGKPAVEQTPVAETSKIIITNEEVKP